MKESLLKKDLGRVPMRLEELQDRLIQATLKPERREVEISKRDRLQAIELLREPNLLNRILDDFRRCGVIGEETNKLVGYLAAVSTRTRRDHMKYLTAFHLGEGVDGLFVRVRTKCKTSFSFPMEALIFPN